MLFCHTHQNDCISIEKIYRCIRYTLNMIIKTIYFTNLGTKYNIITKTGFGIELLQREGDLCKSTSYAACFIYFLAMRNKTLVSRTTS